MFSVHTEEGKLVAIKSGYTEVMVRHLSHPHQIPSLAAPEAIPVVPTLVFTQRHKINYQKS